MSGKKLTGNGLTEKQALFVVHYLSGPAALNAAKAAEAAGYSANGSRQTGEKLLRNPGVAAALRERRTERNARLGDELDLHDAKVITHLSRIAFFDIRKLFDDDGNPLPMGQLDEETAAALQSVEVVKFGNADAGRGSIMKIRMADKLRALELLARHLGLLNDKLTVGVEPDNPLAALLSFLQAGAGRITPTASLRPK